MCIRQVYAYMCVENVHVCEHCVCVWSFVSIVCVYLRVMSCWFVMICDNDGNEFFSLWAFLSEHKNLLHKRICLCIIDIIKVFCEWQQPEFLLFL